MIKPPVGTENYDEKEINGIITVFSYDSYFACSMR